MQVLLLTPYKQSDLGLMMFRIPRNAAQVMTKRMVLMPEPIELQHKESGVVNWQGAISEEFPPLVVDFLKNKEVRSKLLTKKALMNFVASIKHCQLSDGEYCHKELTITPHLDGFIRTCWHHDTEMRKGNYDEEKASLVVEQNIEQAIIAKIQVDLKHARPLTESDLVLYCFKNGLQRLLSDALLRKVFSVKNYERDNKESSTRFEDPLIYHMDRLDKAILNLKADDDPPLQYMARPKPQYIRSEKWLRWVKTQPCVCCGKQADDPHHLIGHGNGVMGSKADDLDCIPLCRIHHNELHQNVKAFEEKYGSQIELWHKFFLYAIKIGALVVD